MRSLRFIGRGTCDLTIFLLMFVSLLIVGIAKNILNVSPTYVEIKIGGSTNITCTTDRCDDVSKLHFVQKDTNQRVPQSEIIVPMQIAGRRTIVYVLQNAKEQNRSYKCMCNEKAIGIAQILVGTPPLDVTEFKCRCFDYTFMVCNFTKPRNMLPTQYNLNYTAQVPYIEKCKHGIVKTVFTQNYGYTCELKMQEHYGICNLTGQNYRSHHEYYNFTLTAHNALGTRSQSFWINHFESVVPPGPDIQIDNTTATSAHLSWKLNKYSFYNNKGLQYDVQLKPNNFDWLPNYTSYDRSQENATYRLLLRDLPYSYYNYTVHLRLRVQSAGDATEWGETIKRHFRTDGTLPQLAPRTDVGSFYIGSSEPTVRLYWQQLAPHQQNADNFSYVLTQVSRDGVPIHLKPFHLDRISATLQWNNSKRYEYTIKSKNAIGESLEASRIIVPRMPAQHAKFSPRWIRNMYHARNGTYTLLWTAPENVSKLVDYTVFWCPSKRANTNECQGTINFRHCQKESTTFSIAADTEHSLNFAVSANHKGINTGMHWTMCTVDATSDLVKIEPKSSTPHSSAILIEWSTDRICNSLIEGYNLTYCKVQLPLMAAGGVDKDAPCSVEERTLIIEKNEKSLTLDNLEPFTTYKIQMYMYSEEKRGAISDPQYVTTREEAPTSPRYLKYHNISSNSAWISWLPPAHLNGNLKYYTVLQNNQSHIINCTIANGNTTEENICNKHSLEEEIFYELANLSSFTDYSVEVTAHTVAMSLPSNRVDFKTMIGRPSKPRHGKTEKGLVQWLEPDAAAGRVEFYEVEFNVFNGHETEKAHISVVVGAKSCNFTVPSCPNSNYTYTLRVRAVNVASLATEVDPQLLLLPNANAKDYSTAIDAFTAFDTQEEQLQCIGRSRALSEKQRAHLLQGYRNTQKNVLFKSEWEQIYTHYCGGVRVSKPWIFLSILFASMGLAIALATVQLYRKCSVMKNIECILPDGLNNVNGMETHGKCSNKAASTKHNESDRLLSKEKHIPSGSECGMSSGYIGSDRSTDECSMVDCSIAPPRTTAAAANCADEHIYIPMLMSSALEAPLSAPLKPQAAVMPALQRPINEESASNEMALLSSNGYVHPSSIAAAAAFAKNSKSQQLSPSGGHNADDNLLPQTNCYITNLKAAPISTITNNATNKAHDGYTTVDATGRIATTIDAPTGYVTQRELLAIGHRPSLYGTS